MEKGITQTYSLWKDDLIYAVRKITSTGTTDLLKKINAWRKELGFSKCAKPLVTVS